MFDSIDCLSQEFAAVGERWRTARAAWRDSVAVEFERVMWDAIRERSLAFLHECHALDEVFTRAEHAIAAFD